VIEQYGEGRNFLKEVSPLPIPHPFFKNFPKRNILSVNIDFCAEMWYTVIKY